MNRQELSQDVPPQLTRMVNNDTPQGVYVPSQWTGIILWALGRFGIGIVFVYAAWMIYQDNKILTERLMAMTEKNMELQTKHIQVVESLNVEIRDLKNQLIFRPHNPQ